MVTQKELKKVGIKKYIYGDFDKDGVKNIDDPKPFDKNVSKYPSNMTGSYYHVARYGGGEVLLSDELKALEDHNNKRSPLLKGFIKANKGAYGRIKTIPSTMKKLRERHINKVMDIAGASIRTKDRKEAKKTAKRIKKNYKYDKKETDDYYKNPKGGVHYAYHIGVVDKKDKDVRLEVQVKSKKMAQLQAKMHPIYKKGKSLARFRKPAKKLFDKGY